MDVRQANKLETKDTKTGQAEAMRTDNVFYDDYANMSAEKLAELRKKRQDRASFSGKVMNTYIPPEFKNENLHYEWVIYDPILVDQKVKNGWIVIADEKLAKMKGCSTSSQVTIPSGLSNNRGEPEYLILMALHKALYEEDIATQKRRIKEFNDQMDSGKTIATEGGEALEQNLEVKEISIQ